MIALVSAKGSPGVSCAALALALATPRRCLLAECDPAGGDYLAGYLQGTLPADRGLARLAVAELRGRLAEEFPHQLVDLDAPRRRLLLLPGVDDPAQSATVATVWPAIAEHLHAWAADEGGQVIADCGRIGDAHFGWAVLRRSARVLLVVRTTLPSVSSAVSAVRGLQEQLAGSPAQLGLLVVTTGPYRPSEVAGRLGVPVAGTLPEDRRAAERLSLGGAVHRRMPLLRAAAAVQERLAALPAERPAGLTAVAEHAPEAATGPTEASDV